MPCLYFIHKFSHYHGSTKKNHGDSDYIGIMTKCITKFKKSVSSTFEYNYILYYKSGVKPLKCFRLCVSGIIKVWHPLKDSNTLSDSLNNYNFIQIYWVIFTLIQFSLY